MALHARMRLLVDSKAQGSLLIRTAVYWLSCIAVMSVVLVCWELVSGIGAMGQKMHYDQIWYRYAPALVTSLLMLPFVLLDVARLSNRMVGPLDRLRKGMRELAEGKPVAPLQFRQDDFWPELADEFNALRTIVEQAQRTGCGQATVVMDRAEMPEIAGKHRG